jgi:hypothetical protein
VTLFDRRPGGRARELDTDEPLDPGLDQGPERGGEDAEKLH